MGKFNFIKTEIPEVQIIEPTVFGDDRGYFMETYQIDEFAAAGIDKPFMQDNRAAPPRACCAACISRSSIRRASWCVPSAVLYLMWQ